MENQTASLEHIRREQNWNKIHRKGKTINNKRSEALKFVDSVARKLMKYESDTFSAKGSKLTEFEAYCITIRLMKDLIVPSENVDGVDLTYWLDKVRQ